MRKKLLIATTNPGKIREIQALLSDLDLDLVSPSEIGLQLSIPETGSTYRENAAQKAQAYWEASGLITLADDSGLEVAALGGAPGYHSARYAPEPGANDADRRRYLLAQLSDKPRPWQARFYCLVAIAAPSEDFFYTEGICPGEIIPQERGSGGFGYDPIFLLPQLGQTMAELPMDVKNKVSHRGRAVLTARPWLENLIKT